MNEAMTNGEHRGSTVNRADRKRAQLRRGLAGERPVVAVGAHDAMTAKLIGQHNFDAVWVSGLGVSTMAHALPDLNLITMTEALAAAIRIDAATELPVIADCDNGFGGLANVVRTLIDYERAGISAICIEDNLFPKRNSLYTGDSNRALIPRDEQARRIRAAKRAQETDDFVLIARVEALIAGLGVEDACARADAYANAGADAILIHSRDKTLREIEGFLESWQGLGRIPLVAVPTLFPTFTAAELHAKGFQLVILANQPMRAAIRAIEETLRELASDGRAAAVDPDIATVDHVFDLVGTAEVIALEDQVGPATAR
jgi:phosphoenolpyruvate phosphomutase